MGTGDGRCGAVFTPLAAAGTIAAAASVPIIIHLLNRRRYRIVDWAAMRFLLAAEKQNSVGCDSNNGFCSRSGVRSSCYRLSRWRRLHPGPSRSGNASCRAWRSPPIVSGRTHKVLILDGTLSMTVRRADGTHFDRARRLAAELIRSSARGDGFSVILVGTPIEAVVPGPAEDAAKVEHEIDGLRCSHGAGDLTAALNLAEELIRRVPGKFAQREIHVFTDLQRATWPPSASPSGGWTEPWTRLQAQAQLIVVDVGHEGMDNLAISDLSLAEPLAVVGVQNSVTATVSNFSSIDRTGVRVELLVGHGTASPVVVDQQPATISAGGRAAISFPFQWEVAGDHVVQVRLPADTLEADDVRSMIVSARNSLPVLLVNGKPAAERREQAASWLADALNPFVDDVRRPTYPARPKTIDLAQFADPITGDLAPYDAIFLCDVPRLTEREVARLEAHLRRGGGVVISLGPDVDLENYNRLLSAILPGRLVGMVRAPADEFFTLAADGPAFQRPPLAPFAADNDRAALLGVRFREYVRVESAPGLGARPILTFIPPKSLPADAAKLVLADPLVVECPRHRGRVVLVTSSLNTDWTSWPIAPSYPPFMHELLRMVVPASVSRTGVVGEPLGDLLPPESATGRITIHTPDGRDETIVPVSERDSAALRFAGTDQSGLYRVKVDGLHFDRQYAVNASSGTESDLHRLAPAELLALTPDEDVQVVTKLEDVRRHPKRTSESPSLDEFTVPAAARSRSGQHFDQNLVRAVVCRIALGVALWHGAGRLQASDRTATALVRSHARPSGAGYSRPNPR